MRLIIRGQIVVTALQRAVDITGYVCAALRAVRERLGLSQEELAYRAKLDRTYISGIERDRRNPSLRSLQRIVAALDISLDELFVRARKPADEDRAVRPKAQRSKR